MSSETCASPLKWHGGKRYLAPKLISFLPPHTHRVHPYAGGLSELFAWPHEGVSEVVNDLNGELSNFWHVLKNESTFAMFQRLCESTPFSEAQFERAHGDYTESPPVWRAWSFFVRCRQSRQGLMKDFATLSRTRVRRGMNEQVSAWLTSVEGLADVHSRLKRVVILNRDALDVIRQQDGPGTLYYLDPPYLHDTRSSCSDYAHEMTDQQHQDLLTCLGSIQGKFMLSGYPSDLYAIAEACHGWRHVDFDLPNNASSKSSKERKTERVWMNF